MDSTEGRVVMMNEVKSSLMSKGKRNQDQDPILVEVKANVHMKKSNVF